MNAREAVEQAARDSYGRLLAFLAARSRDVAAAEDALADAFLAALKTWPQSGVPERPEGWLLTAARRRLIDALRHARVQADAIPTLQTAAEEARDLTSSEGVFPDERLKLLFICAHPAIDSAARTPLMLQTVLGLDAGRIASAFLLRPSAMGQRLTRAKAKIRDARIAFEVPVARELPARLDAVLEAIYAAYGSGWDDVAGADARRKGLAAEAMGLGRLLLHLLPAEPEAMGLMALMLHCEARRDARRTSDGVYVPLSEQDVAQWSRPMIEEAEQLLMAAEKAGRIGRFQLEAAVAIDARAACLDWPNRLGDDRAALRRAGAPCAHSWRAGKPRGRGGRSARGRSRMGDARNHPRRGGSELPTVLGARRASTQTAQPRLRSGGRLRPRDRTVRGPGNARVPEGSGVLREPLAIGALFDHDRFGDCEMFRRAVSRALNSRRSDVMPFSLGARFSRASRESPLRAPVHEWPPDVRWP